MDAILNEIAAIPGHKVVTWTYPDGEALKSCMIDTLFEWPTRKQLATAGLPAAVLVRRTDSTRMKMLQKSQRKQCGEAHCVECFGTAAGGTPVKVLRGYATMPGGKLQRLDAATVRVCFNTSSCCGGSPLPSEPAAEFE